ncbi:hypothetical protein KAR91_26340 [Candidatus Pacearchaeota archaeon]|nr:hypothetical protein [Candidatus Pacearchaeota archaeon]
MRKLLFVLLIFIFVVCFFFIPHGVALASQDDSRLGVGAEPCIVPMAQMPLIDSNPYDNDLLCEATYATGQTALKNDKVGALAYGITSYKAMKPWGSFHAGKRFGAKVV